jgi:hypothetical protein
MMKYLQKLGKALMLPVAALPVCGILMGIGYALAPAVMGAEGATSGAAYTVGFLLIKAGGALIDNMAWLFAIGAAVGLSDDHDGTAGLAGLVSFLMMQQLLSPGVVGAVRTLEEGSVDYIAFSKIAGNSFIGILAAIIGAACYNKFKNTQLPDWLAFFSGKRQLDNAPDEQPHYHQPQAILDRLAEVSHEDFHQYSITWCAAKAVAAVLFVVALPLMVVGLLIGGIIKLALPLLLIAAAFYLLKSCA